MPRRSVTRYTAGQWDGRARDLKGRIHVDVVCVARFV